jgi:hypothetical protein
MDKEELLKMIQDDDLGLLVVKPRVSAGMTADERLYSSFQDINQFVCESGREPKYGVDIREHQLATRLKSLREDAKKSESLAEFDEHNLLDVPKKEIVSLEDIFQDDDLGLLAGADESLFELKYVTSRNKREDPDYIAHRKVCADFEKYADLFQECQSDLASGKRKLLKFTSDRQIQEKSFFVLNGLLLFIDEIREIRPNKHGRLNGRQRCIFENGTESEMLFRSLARRLYDNGHAISDKSGEAERALLEHFSPIREDDRKTGFIYILKSLSQDPRIQSVEHLYKIGFSNIPVEERIQNASQEPTYLMAPVAIVSTFECYNFNPQKLEQLLHNFFGSSCLNIDIFDAKQQRHSPREWFIAPLSVIEKAVELIISGGIVNYRYDSDRKEIALK